MVTAAAIDDIRYPVGEFRIDPDVTLRSGRCGWSRWLKRRPNCAPPYAACLRSSLIRVIGKEGWTLRQVVHHLADAQLNGFTRFKLCFDRGQVCNQDI